MSNLVDPNTLAAGFWDGLDATDFAVPRVSIGQPTSDKGLPGKFNFNNGSHRDDMLECKLIVPSKTRVLYAGRGRSRCASDNYYEPSKRIVNPVSPNCLACPLSQWETNPEKEAMAKELGADSKLDLNKPLCAEVFNLLMADKDWNLFFIGFQKTQLKVVKDKLFSRLKYGFNGEPPFQVAFDMKLKKVSGANKSYYEVEFENFRVAPDKQRGAELVAMWKSRAAEVLAHQHEEMDKQHDGPRTVNDPPMPTAQDAPDIDTEEKLPF